MINSRRRFVHLGLLGSASIATWGATLSTLKSAVAAASDTDDAADTDNNACNSLLSHELRPLMGPTPRPLCEQFSNQVLLIVNTASKCGFTPQFEELETLHQRYADQGFQVLGFPSGDFRQELESEEAVAQFCELNYGVSFPMFEKIHVTGSDAHPLYRQLATQTGSAPNWNFNKYLVDRTGKAIHYYSSGARPLGDQIVQDIEALL